MSTRSVPPGQGEAAWKGWLNSRNARAVNHFGSGSVEPGLGSTLIPKPVSREDVAAAVRYTLGLLSELAPGRSVEVRVIPFGAVQVIEGTKHRRGTPPAVVEMGAETWLQVASGERSWREAEESGDIDVSGERADLSRYLPLAV